VNVEIPDQLVEAIAKRAAEIVLERLVEQPRWLYGAKAAAEYLGWPVKRVNNKIAELPHHRDGGRLSFRTDELDTYLREV
jgi:hypothetical protein